MVYKTELCHPPVQYQDHASSTRLCTRLSLHIISTTTLLIAALNVLEFENVQHPF